MKTASTLRDQAIGLLQTQHFAEALPIFHQLIGQAPSDWDLQYMAGQCARFLNDFPLSISHLQKASRLNQSEPQVFLALGIALQLAGRYDESIEALKKALVLNPDMDTAYNSLAMTQKKMGELDLALQNYDGGIKALTRQIINAMMNTPENPILKFQDTQGKLWGRYAMEGAIYLCSSSRAIKQIAWPTGEQASREEQTEEHRGLYWTDSTDSQENVTRLFLPNYFNTFRETLRAEPRYSNLLGNRGTVLDMLGRQEEAQEHFTEAEEFMPCT